MINASQVVLSIKLYPLRAIQILLDSHGSMVNIYVYIRISILSKGMYIMGVKVEGK